MIDIWKRMIAAGACIALMSGCSMQVMDVLREGKNEMAETIHQIGVDWSVPPKEQAYIQHVPFVRQMPELPRGCEVTSLAMVLQYHGIQTDKMQLAKKIKHVPFLKNGKNGHPNEGFVGDMYSKKNPGYGVYHKPVAQLAELYAPGRVMDLTGRGIEDVYQAVSQGSPVWVVTNVTFQPLQDDQFVTWQTGTGPLRITYYEHSVVIVGYDEQFVYVHDPLADKPKGVNKVQFEAAWVQMGKQAVAIAAE